MSTWCMACIRRADSPADSLLENDTADMASGYGHTYGKPQHDVISVAVGIMSTLTKHLGGTHHRHSFRTTSQLWG
jgi:hypothetical protein